jgi:hypothetical protein
MKGKGSSGPVGTGFGSGPGKARSKARCRSPKPLYKPGLVTGGRYAYCSFQSDIGRPDNRTPLCMFRGQKRRQALVRVAVWRHRFPA